MSLDPNSHPNSHPGSHPDSVDGARRPLEMNRRQLLQFLGLGSLTAIGAACTQSSGAAPRKGATKTGGSAKAGSAAKAATAATAAAGKPGVANDRILVVLEIQGGNDGFATLVPYADDKFRKLRDRVWIDPKELHMLDDRYAISKGLEPVANRLSFIEGVGVAKPDLSHFEMSQRWWRGDPGGGAGSLTGFLGRCCDASAGREPVTGVTLGGGSTPSLVSAKATTVALPAIDLVRELSKDEEEQRRLKKVMATLARNDTQGFGGESTNQLMAIARNGLNSSLDLSTMVGRIGEQPKEYPDSDIARSLAMTRQLISINAGIKIFHIPWGSLDTHTNQVGTHNDHMNRLGLALDAFAKDLEANGLKDRVLLASTSEFGRRAEASANGTDHGTASTMFMMGPVKSGRHGAPVNFKSLDGEGNVKATTNMADYYATLANWIGVRPDDVLAKGSHTISTLGI
jgi:uncharacterized protein (DUF1501 family)